MPGIVTDAALQSDMQPQPNGGDLAPEAIQFAHRMFNAARQGDGVLLQAVDAGLPPNMTNDEGSPSELPVSGVNHTHTLISQETHS